MAERDWIVMCDHGHNLSPATGDKNAARERALSWNSRIHASGCVAKVFSREVGPWVPDDESEVR